MATIFGKIAKWLADLKTVAFSGKYADLSEIPSEFDPSAHANTHSKDGSDPITPESIGAASASKLYYGTLLATGWVENEQTVSIPGLPADAEGDVRIAVSATDDEFLAWSAAIPRVTAHSSGSVTITAYGDVPTINIPFEIYTSNVPVSVTGITSIDGSTPTSFSGILKGTGSAVAVAVPGTDYATPTQLADKQAKITATGLLKGDGAGSIIAAQAGTDYQAPLTAGTDYAPPSQSITATLLSTGWADNAYTLSIVGITADTNGYIGLSQTASAQQRAAWGAALPYISQQTNGTIIISLDSQGTVPTIDIPLEVTIL